MLSRFEVSPGARHKPLKFLPKKTTKIVGTKIVGTKIIATKIVGTKIVRTKIIATKIVATKIVNVRTKIVELNKILNQKLHERGLILSTVYHILNIRKCLKQK